MWGPEELWVIPGWYQQERSEHVQQHVTLATCWLGWVWQGSEWRSPSWHCFLCSSHNHCFFLLTFFTLASLFLEWYKCLIWSSLSLPVCCPCTLQKIIKLWKSFHPIIPLTNLYLVMLSSARSQWFLEVLALRSLLLFPILLHYNFWYISKSMQIISLIS